MSLPFRPRSGYSYTDKYNAVLPVIKMRLENEIVRKREAETRRCETARSNDRYFQQWHLQTEKFDDWTSPRSVQLSNRLTKLTETEHEVQARREKLKALYQEDKQKQELALRKMKEDEEKLKWEKMKDKVQYFRQSRETKLKEMVESREHEQWKSNSASFKEFESELKKQQQQEVWRMQLQQREDEKMRLIEEKKREALQIQQIVQEDKKKEEAEHKAEWEKKMRWKADLDAQMELLKSKDSEANEKRREHERLMAESIALEAVREELRRKEEEKLKKRQNGEFLQKQHLAKLRQRSKEVAIDLENEKSFAEKLFSSSNSSNKEKAREEIQRFLQLVEHHRRVEKERLAQTEFLFQEEAKRMWEKREQEWEAERLARKKLMEEVIAVQEKQIELKLRTAQREREKLLEDREEIVQSLESYRKKMENREMEHQARKIQTKEDLLTQMNDKKQREQEVNKLEQQERERRELMEERYNEKHWNLAMDRLRL